MNQGTAAHSRAVLERLMEMITSGEYDALGEVLHPDFVQVMPQSGEKVVGIENFRKILENIPGSGRFAIDPNPYVSGHEHYMMTPTFNVVRLEADADDSTSYVKATYPDGSVWYIISFASFKEGKIVKRVDFYAPLFEPPDWRAEWVAKT